jgi:outer membrane lipoprotein-sorting protein
MVMAFMMLLLLLGTASTLPFASQSVEFSTRLDKVEASVATITTSLNATTAILTRLEAKLGKEFANVKTEFANVKKDIKALDSKFHIAFAVQCFCCPML